jgi:autotransporter-associated beta strand protein
VDLASLSLDTITFGSAYTAYSVLRPPGNTTNTITLQGDARVRSLRAMPLLDSSTPSSHVLGVPLAGSAGLRITGPGPLAISPANTFTGGTRIDGGAILLVSGDGAFGDPPGSATLDAGTVRTFAAPLDAARTFHLLGAGTIDTRGAGVGTLAGPLTGTGTFNKSGDAPLYVTAGNTMTGAAHVRGGAMVLRFGGTARDAAHVHLTGTLTLDNGTMTVANRLGAATALTFNGGTLHTQGTTVESVGPTTFAGGLATYSLASAATLASSGASRLRGAAANFADAGVGTGVTAQRVFFTTPPALVGGNGAPGTPNLSIIPWAYGRGDGGFSHLVTYDATRGVRTLDPATEYTSAIPPGMSAANVRISGTHALGAPATVNALYLNSTSSDRPWVAGGATLTVTSGAVLAVDSFAEISCPLDFGATEGSVHALAPMTISGAVSGTGGLTKSSSATLDLTSADSTYTGVTTVSGGQVTFTQSVVAGQPGPLGADTSSVVLAPAGTLSAMLRWGGAGTGTFDRDLHVAGNPAAASTAGFARLIGSRLTVNGNVLLDTPLILMTAGPTTTLTINGQVSGPGRILDVNGTGANFVLTGQNTYTGGTDMFTALYVVGSDSALGTGPLRLTGTPRISAMGAPRVVANEVMKLSGQGTYWTVAGDQDVTFTGSIALGGSARVHTIINTAVTTYAGELHDGGLTKAGPGLLVLAGDNAYLGNTVIVAGTLALRKTPASNAWRPVLDGPGGADVRGGALVFDYAAGASPAALVLAILDAGYDQSPQFSTGPIRSSTANAQLGLGWIDVSSTSQLRVVLTRYGDANLDGVVDLTDFNRLAGSFGATNALWRDGDFNYDGLVNLADFNGLAANFGAAAGPDGPTPNDWAYLASAIPEPLGRYTLASALVLRVRCRKRAGNSSH